MKYPITIQELKEQLHSEESDTFLQNLIARATEIVEKESGIALTTQTRTFIEPHFPRGHHRRLWFGEVLNVLVQFPSYYHCPHHTWQLYPVNVDQSSVVITYYDANNELQTLANTDDTTVFRFLSRDRVFCFVVPVNAWPVSYNRPDAVSITYNTVPTVSEMAKARVILRAGELHENREAAGEKKIYDNAGYDRLKWLDTERYYC